MQTRITKIGKDQPEYIEIHCYRISEEVREIIAFVKSRQGQLTGTADERQYEIAVSDVFFIESVDNKTFIYTKNKVYETRHKLYELEEMLKTKSFLRVQKSMLINLMKIKSIKPALSGRYTALLKNGEEIVISRKYVADLKTALKE